MSVFDLIVGAAGWRRLEPSAKATGQQVATPWIWPTWRQNQPDWTEPTLQGFTEAGYNTNSIIYACLARKSQTAALAPMKAYTGERDEPELVPDNNPLAILLRQPNAHQGWYAFMELLIIYLELDGNAFVYMARGASGKEVVGLYPLRSDRVRIVPGTSDILGYVYDPSGVGNWRVREPFLPEEIIHVKYPNPGDPFEGLGRGTSPLGAAARSVDVDNSTTSFLKNFFDNAVVPYGLLKSSQKLFDADVQRIRARLKEQYGGQQNWGEVMILDSDAEYQRLGLSMQEMTFSDLDARNEARICSVLGVPPIIVGAKIGLDRSTFANYGEARRSFWEDTLIPGVYQRFEDAFNSRLSTPDIWLAYDYERVPALQDDEIARWETAVRAFLGGVATRNEARALVKLEPVDDARDGFRATDQQQIGVPAITQTPATVDGEGEVEGDLGLEGEKRHPFDWLSGKAILDDDGQLAARAAIERAGVRKIRAALKAQFELAVPAGMTVEDAQGAEQRLGQGTAALRLACYQVLRDAVMLGVRVGIEQVDGIMGFAPGKQAAIVIDWELVNEAALAWARQAMFGLVTGIDDTSRQRLRSALARWIEDQVGGAEGEFISPLEDLIVELTPVFGEGRAALIAVTEVTRAYAEGNIKAWQASGIITKMRWATANDERVCPMCSALGGLTFNEDGSVPASIEQQQADGIVTAIGTAFVHPGGNGDQQRYAGQVFEYPPAHPRCRCWLIPVVGG